MIRTNPERGWTQFLFLRSFTRSPHTVPNNGRTKYAGFLQKKSLKPDLSIPSSDEWSTEDSSLASGEKAYGPDRRVYTVTPREP